MESRHPSARLGVTLRCPCFRWGRLRCGRWIFLNELWGVVRAARHGGDGRGLTGDLVLQSGEFGDEGGAAVDQSGVELDQAGAGLEFFLGVGGAEDAADADDGQGGSDL